uniref:Uncharacterized protein n=1 Tax=Arundo donax TaxID=35708 RepID=A0A0A9HSL5_ARUDO
MQAAPRHGHASRKHPMPCGDRREAAMSTSVCAH